MKGIFEYNFEKEIIDKEIIIFGCFQSAREFSMRLLGQNMHFDKFLFPSTDDNICLPQLFNKPIININDCNKLENIAIAVPWVELEEAREILASYQLDKYIVEFETLSKKVTQSDEVVIYATGGRAKKFYNNMKKWINIQYFCDTDIAKAGTFFCEKEIISPSDLTYNTMILIASTYYEEICNTLHDYGIPDSNIFIVGNENELFFYVDKQFKYSLKESVLHDVLRDIGNKKVVFYGEDELTQTVVQKLQLLNVVCAATVTWKDNERDGSVYSLLYMDKEDTMFLFTDPYSSYIHSAIEDMGIDEKNIIWLSCHSSFYKINKEKYYRSAIDPNIGHAYVSQDDIYPGFVCHQYLDDAEPIRILTFGGSTTSGYGKRQESWCRYLSVQLKEHGISHILYNGGIDAYSASNELLKLIRDGIWLKPDMVINYSGINNMYRWTGEAFAGRNLFINAYQETIFERMVGKIQIPDFGKLNAINYGINPQVDDFEYWITQERMIHAVCNELGIHQITFLQPALLNKKQYKESDGNIAILYDFLFDNKKKEYVSFNPSRRNTVFYHNSKDFREKGALLRIPWLYNLADLFDDYENIYMDHCHVYEEGNKIIALNIFGVIQKELLEIQQKKKEGE